MRKLILLIAFSLLPLPAFAQPTDTTPPGVEGGPCRNNNTCNAGLVCVDDMCIREGAPGLVHDGDYTIFDWETCDAFATYVGIQGDLTVFGYEDVMLCALDLEWIEGRLHVVQNPDLTNLSGLDRVHTITGGIRVEQSHALVDLTGLGSLTRVGGGLSVINNLYLESLNGVQGVTSYPSGIGISMNPSLTSLQGLENVTHYAGGLTISMNDALADVDELSGVTVAGGVNISLNSSLSSVDGLRNVVNAGSVKIAQNRQLTSLEMTSLERLSGYLTVSFADSGDVSFPALLEVRKSAFLNSNRGPTVFSFPSLGIVGGNLTMNRNAALSALDFPALSAVGETLQIQHNPALSQCEALALRNQVQSRAGVAGEVRIQRNDTSVACN